MGGDGVPISQRRYLARREREDAARPSRQNRWSREMSPAKRRTLFERLAALDPNPKTELQHSTPFELLVSVVLSAQATDKSVNKATKILYRVANTPAAIVKLGV